GSSPATPGSSRCCVSFARAPTATRSDRTRSRRLNAWARGSSIGRRSPPAGFPTKSSINWSSSSCSARDDAAIMRIAGGRVITCSPGRNFVTLKLETEDGLYGLGDATLNGRELAVASYLADHVVPLLVGLDARRIEDIWQFLHKGAYWRRGPVPVTAIAAVDTALWDLKGKMLGAPVYQLLGGASRDSVMVYGHSSGDTIERAVEAAAGYVARGYKAVRVQTAVPGVARTYG